MRGLSGDYPAYPEIEAQFGYNPARFLDVPVRKNDRTKELSAKVLIRGIDDIDTIRAWIEVEVDLGRADGGPRREIIKWLNRRQAQIESNDAAAPSTAVENDGATTSTTIEESTAADAERARDEEPSEPAPDAPETASNRATTASDREPVLNPTCPVCDDDLVPEETAGQRGYWCCECHEFREPASDPPSPSIPSSSADDDSDDDTTTTPGESSTTATVVATDGGAPDPDTPPPCPDCHGELPTETVGGEDDAHWCSYCGRVVRVGVAV